MPQGLTDAFYGFEKSRKRSSFAIYSYLKYIGLQQLKCMQSTPTL